MRTCKWSAFRDSEVFPVAPGSSVKKALDESTKDKAGKALRGATVDAPCWLLSFLPPSSSSTLGMEADLAQVVQVGPAPLSTPSELTFALASSSTLSTLPRLLQQINLVSSSVCKKFVAPSPSQTFLTPTQTQVQSSDAAWSIVGPLLSQPDPSVRFFAASTLQLKISRAWPTLPSLHYDSLKSSLLSWLSLSAVQAYPAHGTARAGERVVLRKLASAVTSLSLRLEDWEDWLLEVVVRVTAGDGTAGGGSGREAVLEVLAVVIEQVARAELVGTKRCVGLITRSTGGS